MGDKRYLSMSSLNTNISDLSIDDPRLLSPAQPGTGSTDYSDYSSPRKSPPDQDRPSSAHYPNGFQHGPPATHSPFMNATHLSPMMEDGNGMLQPPPPLLKPIPQRIGSPTNSRPLSSAGPGSRPQSRDFSGSQGSSRLGSRAASPSKYRPVTPSTESRLKKRRSWMPGRATMSDAAETTDQEGSAQAWMVTPNERVFYDLDPLIHFQQVHELWDQDGDTLVYLHDKKSGPGPSFRLDSSCFASSTKMVKAAHGETHGANGHNREPSGGSQLRSFADRAQGLVPNGQRSPVASPNGSSSNRSSSTGGRSTQDDFDDPTRQKQIHLYLLQPLQTDLNISQPHLTRDDWETLLTVRNLFAFLTGKPLVATSKRPSVFAVFLHMAEILHRYNFTNIDGSTMGEEAQSHFLRIVEDFRIADVRASREKTLEAIILGERMKCWDLYNEGYVHAVGKYADLSSYKSPKVQQISDVTRKNLERSNIFLSTRLRDVQNRLNDFDFPGLFAGIANSSTSSESKIIDFKAWKTSFSSMRRHAMTCYKQRYGAWPPKANSKKNNFEESGLNRLLLRQVYQDLCNLYDVLADRSNFTTRHVEIPTEREDDSGGPNGSLRMALRRVLGEYDRSTPPVQPPIPFDTPLLPTLSSTRRGFDTLDPKKQKKECAKKLSDSEINTALMQSYNRDLMKSTPFLQAFFAYERRSAHGKSIEEIVDLRIGQWLFMYAVIQALPLLVVDAPGVRYTDGVEYFLSEFCKDQPPWMRQDHRRTTTWRIPGSETMVDMPVASVEHSKDAIYQRSHCWQVAQQWAEPAAAAGMTSQNEIPYEDLLPPVMPSESGSRASSPDRRLSMGVGLEQLAIPSGVSPRGSRPVSTYDPSKNFNMILGLQGGEPKTKK